MTESAKEKKKKYADWAEEYPNHLVVTHAGFFYMAWGRAAEVLNEILNYSLAYTKNGVAYTGGTSLEIIEDSLQSNNINYVVIDRGRVVEKKDYEYCTEVFYREEDFASSTRANPYDDISDEEKLEIIDALMNGVDPITGEILDDDHLVNTREVKAIFATAKTALVRKQEREKRRKPSSGSRWTEEEDAKLIEEYKSGLSIKEIAELHGRSSMAISRRLFDKSLIEI